MNLSDRHMERYGFPRIVIQNETEEQQVSIGGYGQSMAGLLVFTIDTRGGQMRQSEFTELAEGIARIPQDYDPSSLTPHVLVVPDSVTVQFIPFPGHR